MGKIVVINWYDMSRIVISMDDQYDISMQEKNEHISTDMLSVDAQTGYVAVHLSGHLT